MPFFQPAGFYAASFVGFIHDRYGVEVLRAIWTGGVDEIEPLLGSDLERVESSWKDYLKERVGPETRVDIEAIKDNGCG